MSGVATNRLGSFRLRSLPETHTRGHTEERSRMMEPGEDSCLFGVLSLDYELLELSL